MREKSPKEFESKVLHLTRVSRMTTGGRRFRMRAVVVVGNRKGQVGVGVAKGQDTQDAVARASARAQRTLITVPIVGGSILHEVEAKYGASRVRIKRRPEGFGVRAGGAARAVLELAGVQNTSAKFISRTTNSLTNAMATLKALTQLQPRERAAVEEATFKRAEEVEWEENNARETTQSES